MGIRSCQATPWECSVIMKSKNMLLPLLCLRPVLIEANNNSSVLVQGNSPYRKKNKRHKLTKHRPTKSNLNYYPPTYNPIPNSQNATTKATHLPPSHSSSPPPLPPSQLARCRCVTIHASPRLDVTVIKAACGRVYQEGKRTPLHVHIFIP